jgi:hypothetical protein
VTQLLKFADIYGHFWPQLPRKRILAVFVGGDGTHTTGFNDSIERLFINIIG